MNKLLLLLAVGLLLNACIAESPFNEYKPLILLPPDSCKGALFSLVRPEKNLHFLGESADGFVFGSRTDPPPVLKRMDWPPNRNKGIGLLRFDQEGNQVTQKPMAYLAATRSLPDGYWLIDSAGVLLRTDQDFNVQLRVPPGFSTLQITHTADGGLLLLGYSNSPTALDVLLLEKRDVRGNPQWTRELPTDIHTGLTRIFTNARGDGHWLYMHRKDGSSILEKMGPTGNPDGQIDLGRLELEQDWSLVSTADNGCVVTQYGWRQQGTTFVKSGTITRYNARLAQEWQENMGEVQPTFVVQTGDGYWVTTTHQTLQKRNLQGKLLWSKPIQKGVLRVYDLAATADGGALLFAQAYPEGYYGNETPGSPSRIDAPSLSPNYSTLVLKLDAEGAYCP